MASITSYNVCYTKLLRVGIDETGAVGVFAGQLLQHLEHMVPVERHGRAVHLLGANLRDCLVEQVARRVGIGLQAQVFRFV